MRALRGQVKDERPSTGRRTIAWEAIEEAARGLPEKSRAVIGGSWRERMRQEHLAVGAFARLTQELAAPWGATGPSSSSCGPERKDSAWLGDAFACLPPRRGVLQNGLSAATRWARPVRGLAANSIDSRGTV